MLARRFACAKAAPAILGAHAPGAAGIVASALACQGTLALKACDRLKPSAFCCLYRAGSVSRALLSLLTLFFICCFTFAAS
jgi:hypothetical protein